MRILRGECSGSSNIVVATDVAPIAEIVGVETVMGSVIVANNSALTTVATDNLQTVTGDVVLDTLPLLSNISLPQWTSVGTIILNKIPAPNVLDVRTRVQKVTNLYITDTTLETLFGVLLQTAQMDTLHITGNKFLQDCWFGVGNITQQATIVNNSGQMSLTLPNLTYAYNMEISNASSISMPMLQSVSSNLDVSWNSFRNLSIPELSFVGGELSIVENSQLDELDMMALVNVQGGITIRDNAQLETLDGLSTLSYVGDNLTLDGDFTNATLASLHNVRGDLFLASASGATCAEIPSPIVHGHYTCNAAQGNTHQGGKLPVGAVAGIVLGAVLGLAAMLGSFLWLRYRRRSTHVSEISDAQRPPLPPKEKRSSYGYYEITKAKDTLNDGGKHGEGESVPLSALDKKQSTRTEEHELPTPVNSDVYELPTDMSGAAHELESR
ncbi:protoplasts-secreted [Recurvomyces mirabilis]|uniref:Protoplasts-secreted n=1 Tax=Recurvomyces mirabilis TaxID=574656 RepID=A0AAE0WP96_9PEZI|nr:protoplasts-secreted [Recurvomyces mirabilis]KAK5152939.1 cell wall protein Ecm33 [Recurvomyces mirabilis]